MKIGVIYPQTEYGTHSAAVREFAQLAESLGYSHILAYDHVLGADPSVHKLTGPYTHEHNFHEPFVLLSYLAAATTTIGLTTGVIILPQRQAVLVAKQAASLDVLADGRLRLGVGLGWNQVEYQALGMDMKTRGKRMDEQIALMRRLWTEPLMSFAGEFHGFDKAGLLPLPIQRPIPIWFGGHTEPMLKRAARIGDGWLPFARTPEEGRPFVESMLRHLEDAGRSRDSFGIDPRLNYEDGEPGALAKRCADWQQLGATGASLNTMGFGLKGDKAHLDAITRAAKALGLKAR